MNELMLQQLALLAVLGTGAQWLAWRLGLPSILLLLVGGFMAGPVFNWIDADEMLGELLMPFVSVSVALIMFEGGLTLKFHELRETGRIIRNLISVGALSTWIISAIAARVLFGWDWQLATLCGSILVVTGPTVIMPLLRHVQPTKQIASTLKWEGILIDPIGALLALLVYEAIVARDFSDVPLIAIIGFSNTVFIGTVLGITGAAILLVSFQRHWAPDFLQNPISLMIVVAMFVISNAFQHESGLLTVTVMGIVLANQKWVAIRHIVEFKENLRVLLISALFILLASRLSLEQVQQLSLGSGLTFLAVLMFIGRPVSILISTWGSKMTWKEKLFLSWMAPRGIVAAAVSSLFAFRLMISGHERANELVAVTFMVIVGTVAIYGLTAAPLAKWLRLSKPNPQGVLIVGAHPVARTIGRLINDEGLPVLLADTNAENVAAARAQGLATHHGSVLAENAREDIDLTGIGRLLAMISNAGVNSLAAIHFVEFFGRAGVYHLVPDDRKPGGKGDVAQELQGRRLFGSDVTLARLNERLAGRWKILGARITEKETFEAVKSRHGGELLVMFVISPAGELQIATADDALKPRPGQMMIYMAQTPSNPAGGGAARTV